MAWWSDDVIRCRDPISDATHPADGGGAVSITPEVRRRPYLRGNRGAPGRALASECDDDNLARGGRWIGGHAASPVARAAPAEPARPGHSGRHLGPPPELRGDGTVPADAGDDPAADRAAGRAAARAQRAAA